MIHKCVSKVCAIFLSPPSHHHRTVGILQVEPAIVRYNMSMNILLPYDAVMLSYDHLFPPQLRGGVMSIINLSHSFIPETVYSHQYVLELDCLQRVFISSSCNSCLTVVFF